MSNGPVKVSEKTGLPPGSMVYIGKAKGEPAQVKSIEYDSSNLEEKTFDDVKDCLNFKESLPVTWINVDGIHDVSILESLGSYADLHPLVLEDIVNTMHRPKIDEYHDYIFVMMKIWFWDEDSLDLSSEQVSLILGSSYVITFQEKTEDIFEPIRKRIRAGAPRLRNGGPDYLAYALLDLIVDNYFVVLEKLDERIEALEEISMQDTKRETLLELHQVRSILISLARSVWPLREVLGRLEREDFPLIQASTRTFLRDVLDHTIQVIETIETFRDRVSGVRDIYLSVLSNNMNAIMKFLTIIGTIFIPMTFVTGVYGMNFYIPEIHWRFGYPISLGVMAIIAAGMLIYFRKKKWF